MAISFVRATETSGGLNDSVATLNIQSSGVDRALVLIVPYKSNSTLVPDSVVFNTSEAFTLIRDATDSANQQVATYILTNPSVVTADVVITWPSSVRMTAWVGLYEGVHQTVPLNGNEADAQGTDGTALDSISSAVGELVLSGMCQVANGPNTFTTTGIDTERHNDDATGGSTDARGGVGESAGSATETHQYDLSGSEDWSVVIFALVEAPAPNQFITPAPVPVVSSVALDQVQLQADLAAIPVVSSVVAPVITPGPTAAPIAPAPVAVVSSVVAPQVDLQVDLAPVPVASSVVAPVVSGSGETFITPGPVPVASSVVAPQVDLSLTIPPNVVVTSVVAPVVSQVTDQFITPGPVPVVSSVVAPQVDLQVDLAPVPVASSVVAPVVSGSGSAPIIATPVPVASSIQAPTVAGSGESFTTPASVPVVATVVAPVVAPTGSPSLTPGPVPVASSVVAPVVAGSGEAPIAPAPVAVASSIQAPKIDITLDSPAVIAVSSVVAPVVAGSGSTSIVITPIPVASSIQAPQVDLQVDLVPVLVVTQVVAPVVVGSGETFIVPAPVPVASSVQAPQVDLSLALPSIPVASSVVAPVVSGQGDAPVSFGPVTVVSGVVAPAVTATGSTPIAPAPVPVASSIQAPKIDLTLALPAIAVVSSVVAPFIAGSGETFITFAPVAVASSVVAPQVDLFVAGPPVIAASSVVAPVITATGSAPIAPASVPVASSIVAQVVGGTGASNITLTPVGVASSVTAPAVAGSGETFIVPASIPVAATVVEPTEVKHVTQTTPAAIPVTATVVEPVVTPGPTAAPVAPAAVPVTSSVVAPAVTPGPGAAEIVVARNFVPKTVRWGNIFNGFASGGNTVDGTWRIKNNPATALVFFKIDDKNHGSGGSKGIFGVWEQTSPANDNEWDFRYSNNSSVGFSARRASGGSHSASWSESLFTQGQWYMIEMTHDPVADTITLEINRGRDEWASQGKVLTGITDGIFFGGATATPMEMMGHINGSNRQFIGAVSGAGIWVGRELSNAEKDLIYDTQPSYDDLSDSLKVDLQSWHNCEEPSGGTFVDQAPTGQNLGMINGSGASRTSNDLATVDNMARPSEVVEPVVVGSGTAPIAFAPVAVASSLVAFRIDQVFKAVPIVATSQVVAPVVSGSGSATGIQAGDGRVAVGIFANGYIRTAEDSGGDYHILDNPATAMVWARIDKLAGTQGIGGAKGLFGVWEENFPNDHSEWDFSWFDDRSGGGGFALFLKKFDDLGVGTPFFAASSNNFVRRRWYLLEMNHDPVANTVTFDINRGEFGAPKSVPMTQGFNQSGLVPFEALGHIGGTDDQVDGAVSRGALWNGRILTDAEKDWIFANAPKFDDIGIAGTPGADLLTDLTQWYDFDETTNPRVDSVGGFNFTVGVNGTPGSDLLGPPSSMKVEATVVEPVVAPTGSPFLTFAPVAVASSVVEIRIDQFVTAPILTVAATVSVASVLGSGSAQVGPLRGFATVAINTRPESDVLLNGIPPKIADQHFYATIWAKVDTLPTSGSNPKLMSWWNPSIHDSDQFQLEYRVSDKKFDFRVSILGDSDVHFEYDGFALDEAGLWALVELEHDPVNDEISINVTPETALSRNTKQTLSIPDGGLDISVGSFGTMRVLNQINVSDYAWPGAAARIGIWIGGSVITEAERDTLFNDGPLYEELPAALKDSRLFGYWNLDEGDGATRVDSHGGFNLSNQGSSGSIFSRLDEFPAPKVIRVETSVTADVAPTGSAPIAFAALTVATTVTADVAGSGAAPVTFTPLQVVATVVTPIASGTGTALPIVATGTPALDYRVVKTGATDGYLEGTPNDFSTSPQDNLYTAAGWFRVDDLGEGDTQDRMFMGPWIPGSSNGSWRMYWEEGTQRFRIGWRTPTASGNLAHGKDDYLPRQWVFGVIEHDPDLDQLFFEIDNAGQVSTAFSGGFADASGIGFQVNGSVNGSNFTLDGAASRVGVWKGRRLTPAEKTWMFQNAPNYDELGIPGSPGAALKDSTLQSFWNLTETGNNDRIDSHGTNDLTQVSNPISDDLVGPHGPLRVTSSVVAPVVAGSGSAPVSFAAVSVTTVALEVRINQKFAWIPQAVTTSVVAPSVSGTGTASPILLHGAGRSAENNFSNDFLESTNAAPKVADRHLTAAIWLKFDRRPSNANPYIFGAYTSGGSDSNQWLIQYREQSGLKFRFIARALSGAESVLTYNAFSDPRIGEWIFVEADHDPVTDQLSMNVNRLGAQTLAFPDGGLELGPTGTDLMKALGSPNNPVFVLEGAVSRGGVWIGGTGLTEAERDFLFSEGPDYAQLGIPGTPGADLADSRLENFWNFDEAGGTPRLDSHGSLDFDATFTNIQDTPDTPTPKVIKVTATVVAPTVAGTGSAPVASAPVTVTTNVLGDVAGTGSAPISITGLSVVTSVSIQNVKFTIPMPALPVTSSVVAPVVAGTGSAPVSSAPVVATALVVAPGVAGTGTATPIQFPAVQVASAVILAAQGPTAAHNPQGTGSAPISFDAAVSVATIILAPVVSGSGSAPVAFVPLLVVTTAQLEEVKRVHNIHIAISLDGQARGSATLDGQSRGSLTLTNNP